MESDGRRGYLVLSGKMDSLNWDSEGKNLGTFAHPARECCGLVHLGELRSNRGGVGRGKFTGEADNWSGWRVCRMCRIEGTTDRRHRAADHAGNISAGMEFSEFPNLSDFPWIKRNTCVDRIFASVLRRLFNGCHAMKIDGNRHEALSQS